MLKIDPCSVAPCVSYYQSKLFQSHCSALCKGNLLKQQGKYAPKGGVLKAREGFRGTSKPSGLYHYCRCIFFFTAVVTVFVSILEVGCRGSNFGGIR